MGIRDAAVEGVKWSAIQNWASRGLSTLLFIFLARLLRPEDFGLVALSSVFIALLTIFQEQGLSRTLIQRDELAEDEVDTAFWFGLGAGGVLTILLLFLAPLAGQAFGEPRLTPILRWLSLSFILGGLNSTQAALLYRHLRFKPLAVRSLLATLLSGVLAVGLALNGAGVWALVAQSLAKPAISCVVLWTASDWRPRFRFSRRHLRMLTSFSANILALDLLSFVNRRSDDLLIGAVLGPVALGYYTVAYRLLLTMTDVFTSTVSVVSLPIFSRMQRDLPRLLRAFYAATRMTSALAVPAFVGVAVTAPDIVPVLFGEQWARSIPVMQILTVIGILHSVAFFNRSVMIAVGQPGHALRIALLNAVLNVAFFAVAVRWGIFAVALAYVLRGWLLAPLPLIVLRKSIALNYRDYVRNLMAPLAASTLMALAVLGLQQLMRPTGDAIRLAACVAVGATVYGVAMRLTAPTLFQEIYGTIRRRI